MLTCSRSESQLCLDSQHAALTARLSFESTLARAAESGALVDQAPLLALQQAVVRSRRPRGQKNEQDTTLFIDLSLPALLCCKWARRGQQRSRSRWKSCLLGMGDSGSSICAAGRTMAAGGERDACEVIFAIGSMGRLGRWSFSGA